MRLNAKTHKCSSLLVVSFLTGPTLPGVMAPTEQRGCKERQEHLKSIFIEPSLVTTMMSVNTTHHLRSNKSLIELKTHHPTVSRVNHWKFSFLHSHTAKSDPDTLGWSKTHSSPVIQTDVLCELWFPWHLAKFPCFACHENITGNQGCYMKAPSQHLDCFLL